MPLIYVLFQIVCLLSKVLLKPTRSNQGNYINYRIGKDKIVNGYSVKRKTDSASWKNYPKPALKTYTKGLELGFPHSMRTLCPNFKKSRR